MRGRGRRLGKLEATIRAGGAVPRLVTACPADWPAPDRVAYAAAAGDRAAVAALVERAGGIRPRLGGPRVGLIAVEPAAGGAGGRP